MNNLKDYSRREFLNTIKNTAVLGSLAATLFFHSSCKKKNANQNTNASTSDQYKNVPCPSTELSDKAKGIRANLKYVDQSPIATRTCDNCKLYTRPSANSHCGGCRVVPGLIHPKGYCSSWYYQM